MRSEPSSRLQRWLMATALHTCTPQLSRPIPAEPAQSHIQEVGYQKLGWRAWRRRVVFGLSGQSTYEMDSLVGAGRKGLWIYLGEGQLGDALMDLAPRSLLKAQGFEMDLLTEPHLARLFQGDPWFSEVSSEPQVLQANGYDFIIVLSHKRRSLQVKHRCFRRTPWVSILQSFTGPNFARAAYATQRLSDLLQLPLSPEAFALHAGQKLKAADPSCVHSGEARGAIALCIGGVDPRRTYTHWEAVMTALVQQRHTHFVLLGSDNGTAMAQHLEQAFAGRAMICQQVGRCSLEQTHALIAMAKLVVGSDGGLLHLAATTATPVLGLFISSIKPAWRLPARPRVQGLSSPTLEVDDVPADQVAQAILQLLA